MHLPSRASAWILSPQRFVQWRFGQSPRFDDVDYAAFPLIATERGHPGLAALCKSAFHARIGEALSNCSPFCALTRLLWTLGGRWVKPTS